MSMYVGNIDDPSVRKVVLLLPLSACHCFDRDSTYAGHTVNPPCEAVRLARRIVDALQAPEPEPELEAQRFVIEHLYYGEWEPYVDEAGTRLVFNSIGVAQAHLREIIEHRFIEAQERYVQDSAKQAVVRDLWERRVAALKAAGLYEPNALARTVVRAPQEPVREGDKTWRISLESSLRPEDEL
jgi:hypothetical protein